MAWPNDGGAGFFFQVSLPANWSPNIVRTVVLKKVLTNYWIDVLPNLLWVFVLGVSNIV